MSETVLRYAKHDIIRKNGTYVHVWSQEHGGTEAAESFRSVLPSLLNTLILRTLRHEKISNWLMSVLRVDVLLEPQGSSEQCQRIRPDSCISFSHSLSHTYHRTPQPEGVERPISWLGLHLTSKIVKTQLFDTLAEQKSATLIFHSQIQAIRRTHRSVPPTSISPIRTTYTFACP